MRKGFHILALSGLLWAGGCAAYYPHGYGVSGQFPQMYGPPMGGPGTAYVTPQAPTWQPAPQNAGGMPPQNLGSGGGLGPTQSATTGNNGSGPARNNLPPNPQHLDPQSGPRSEGGVPKSLGSSADDIRSSN